MKSRLVTLKVFQEDALQLAARKVAAVTGDARRVLEICRKAIGFAQADKAKEVTLAHVEQAASILSCSSGTQAVQNCSRHEQLLLRGLSAEFLRTKTEEGHFDKVYDNYADLCRLDDVEPLQFSVVYELVRRLSGHRLLVLDESRHGTIRSRRIRLNMNQDDLMYALTKPG